MGRERLRQAEAASINDRAHHSAELDQGWVCSRGAMQRVSVRVVRFILRRRGGTVIRSSRVPTLEADLRERGCASTPKPRHCAPAL
jgi:hypothetical protein